ncbi:MULTISPECIES: adenosylcobinamide-phosphate synthase CbiB [unclassified Ruegeria]|uniref:adenosylcobinamide-phosphate synthase CbiB n=1 Tax=unclassified Ruegeria TaxID=2625375 RepID=UPI0014883E74|nr:cobalamin biosynthesis protein [Ruegeria sp. HKCCD7296]NOD49505.1 cobalamin biosynthesis protein [Ruegeria sp. HKCCD5849]NOD53818.1 cobalamin biosynthesis protein [Ruegeria sp. HKCCD5851]NOD69833.1 cobalamin biosynthesis protein [Ruegeria sp. HKCCD7303]NOE35462.1 cobalamin biosynthesis protein [Ruegeria sp. HKCCD7318]NOE42478.1 cobalamin biosynthesis protein [Ruegeria sp. HKCCD7319]
MSLGLMLVCAMCLDAALGEPDWLWSRVKHPAVMIGNLIAWLDNRLNHGASRRLKGAGVLAVLVGGACGLGWAMSMLGPVAEILLCTILLAQKSLVEHVRAVGDGLLTSVDEGRAQVAMIVSRDTRDMTEAQVARSAIESAAENLSDGVIAPAFWFLVAGLPGLLIYKAVNTADSMIGYRNEKYSEFGWASARFDDLLNLIPARLTCVLIVALSGQRSRWREIVGDARRHISPNAGWPEAAMARALNVALAGPRSYDGKLRDLAWVNGDAPREIGAAEVFRACHMLWSVWGLALGLVSVWVGVNLIF